MKIYAINGSPRREHNTARLLDAFLEDAASVAEGAETRRVDLYTLDYKGCTECFACKRKGSPSYGRCAYPDELRELLWDVARADVIAFGSPVYFSDISGQLRCFLERLYYPFTAFKKGEDRVIAPKKRPTAFIYSMNAPLDPAAAGDYVRSLSNMHGWTERVLGYAPELVCASNIWQMDDHDRYEMDIWDWEQKAVWRETQFPRDLQNARDTGRRLAARCRGEHCSPACN